MQVIFNADDFGRSKTINTAVLRAYREGVLTSASLMVSGFAMDQAVSIAKDNPSLAVGLHIVTTNGNAVLSHKEIPHLVDNDGRFSDDAVRSGLRYFFSKAAQEELSKEVTAQFERFAATGLPLSHVDGHLHSHIHPTLFGHILKLAEEYGAQGLRLPRDDLSLGLSYNAQRLGLKVGWAIIFGLLSRWCLKHLSGRRLKVTHRVYGLMQSGDMQETYVLKLLNNSNAPSVEIYFHPDTSPEREHLGPNPVDLATLQSPRVKQAVHDKGIRLVTYPTLK